MDGFCTWALSWMSVITIGLSPILVFFMGAVSRAALIGRRRSGDQAISRYRDRPAKMQPATAHELPGS